MKLKKILFLEPFLEEKIWGGDFFKKNGFNTNSDLIGEALIISALPKQSSFIKELNLSLYEYFSNKENKWFFNYYDKEYPLLTKIIYAKQDLSVQVHPNDEYAKNKFNKLGKNECWYILDCEKNNSIIYGHKALDKQQVLSAIKENKWDNFLSIKSIKKNDFIYVPAGKIHAIKANTLIFELQQSSDITFRLYDYNRLENGKLRDLHIDDSLNVISIPDENIIENDFGKSKRFLVNNNFFKLKKINVNFFKFIYCPKAMWLQITVIEGSGKVNGKKIKQYQSFIVAYKTKLFFSGKMTFLLSYI